MRIICLLLAAAILLCSCASSPPAVETVPQSSAANTEASIAPTETQIQPTVPPDPVAELLETMTAEEKVGQLFLARCPSANAAQDAAAYHLGGFTLYAQDIEGQTPDTLRQTIESYQAAAAIPLLIAVDEEGGTVCRVSASSVFRTEPFRSPRALFAEGGMDLVLATEAEKANLLSGLGINVTLGPVCDVTTQSRSFMYSRSLGEDPHTTGEFAIGAEEMMEVFQVGTVLKHFPGYGNNADTHTGTAVDKRSIEELESWDLIPFSMAILADCDAIMVSHTIIQAMDPEFPASLSPAVHEYLRNIMGFEGVIVTDDLYMDAVRDVYGAQEAAVLAVLAGNDLLCCSEYAIQYQAVLEAVHSGRISSEQLDRSVERILRWKQNLGLIT